MTIIDIILIITHLIILAIFFVRDIISLREKNKYFKEFKERMLKKYEN